MAAAAVEWQAHLGVLDIILATSFKLPPESVEERSSFAAEDAPRRALQDHAGEKRSVAIHLKLLEHASLNVDSRTPSYFSPLTPAPNLISSPNLRQTQAIRCPGKQVDIRRDDVGRLVPANRDLDRLETSGPLHDELQILRV